MANDNDGMGKWWDGKQPAESISSDDFKVWIVWRKMNQTQDQDSQTTNEEVVAETGVTGAWIFLK